MRKGIFSMLFLVTVCMAFAAPSFSVSDTSIVADPIPVKKPKNIVLLIGDGMGLTQISAGLYSNNNHLNLERFPFIGLHKSYAWDDLVTDSAAGATAFASGVKTYNAAIGVDKDTMAVPTLVEILEGRGYKTGIVATCSVTHATPASFFAHAASRRLYEEIATFLPKSGVDIFVGGGKKYFNQRTIDNRNIIAELEAEGYTVNDFDAANLPEISGTSGKKFGFFTADEEPVSLLNGRDYFIPAVEITHQFLTEANENGYFLMIEGSQIDWGGHANESDYIISEMIEFDQVIGKVLDWAEKDGETLVVVTADHETGGYAINPGSTMEKIIPAFTTKSHTAALIPVFAYGPGAELFSGIFENTAIFHKILETLKDGN